MGREGGGENEGIGKKSEYVKDQFKTRTDLKPGRF